MVAIADHVTAAALLCLHAWLDRRGARAMRARLRDDEARIAVGGEPWMPPFVAWKQKSTVYALMLLGLATVWLACGRGGEPDAAWLLGFGFAPARWGGWAWAGAGVVAAYASILLCVLNSESWHVPHCPTCRAEWKALLGKNRSVRAHYIGVPGSLQIAAIGAAAEELVWRGYLWWYFSQVGGPWTAFAATAVLFGLFHAGQGFGPWAFATVMGAALGGLRLSTDGLWVGLLLHLGQNVLISALCGSMRRAVRATLVDEDCGEDPPREDQAASRSAISAACGIPG